MSWSLIGNIEGPEGPAGDSGTDGREVEIRNDGAHVQWRYVGDVAWTNIVALSVLTGPAGADGAPGSPGIDGVDGAPGAPGSDGVDGREVELQKTATYIQWRYVGAGSWTNLVALSAITGPAGADGAPGAPGSPGAAGADGSDGSDGADGRGIASIARTSGSGAAGTTDTYTITYSDATTSTFTVVNGANGAAGSAGAAGAAGADGKTVRNGSGAPSSGLGVDGDFYIDTTAHSVYGPKTSGAWGSGTSLVGPTGATGAAGSSGATGAAGADGKTVRSGSGTPSSGLGVDGDFYINTAANTIYGPKASGAWGSATSLVGPAGSTGATGPSGVVAATAPATYNSGTQTIGVTVGTGASTVAAGDDSRITGAAQKSSNLSDLASASTARTNLGLGTAAVKNTGTSSGDVPLLSTGGLLPIARIASGTPDGTKFVRDDGTLVTPSGGGAVVPTNPLAPTGAAYETFPRHGNNSNNIYTPSTGILILAAINLPSGFSVGRIAFVSAAGITSPTHWWFGLYDSSRVQLATTADQTTTAWAGSTLKSLPIATTASGAATSFTTTYTGLHYLGLMYTGSGLTLNGGLMSTAIAALSPVLVGRSTTLLTTPPAFPFTAAAISDTPQSLPYAYVGA